jgi:hypothetical protein
MPRGGKFTRYVIVSRRANSSIDAVPVFLSLAHAGVRASEAPYHSMDVFTPLLSYAAT